MTDDTERSTEFIPFQIGWKKVVSGNRSWQYFNVCFVCFGVILSSNSPRVAGEGKFWSPIVKLTGESHAALTLQSLFTYVSKCGIFRIQREPEAQDGADCETSLLASEQVFTNQWVTSRWLRPSSHTVSGVRDAAAAQNNCWAKLHKKKKIIVQTFQAKAYFPRTISPKRPSSTSTTPPEAISLKA